MTKMKKLFAVVLALAMLLTVASFSASAEEATVTMTATSNVIAKEVDVFINASENVGGLTATLTYDENAVKYLEIGGIDNTPNSEANTVKDNGNGEIAIVLLGNELTIKFESLIVDGEFAFTLKNIKASNVDGTAALTVAETVEATAEYTSIVAMGNTIRETTTVEKQDLGFVSTIIGKALPEDATNVTLGFVAIPRNLLGNNELTLGAVDTLGAVNAEVPVGAASAENMEYVAYINGIADNTTRMGRVICGRFYVKYTVEGTEKIAYSNNDVADKKVTNGVVAKSHVGTCKAMASVILNSNSDNDIKYDVTEGSVINDRTAVENIVGASSTTPAQREAILKFVVTNAALLDANV